MKNVSLNARDRITVGELIQQKTTGNRLEMSLLYDLMQQMDFTPREIEAYDIKFENNGVFIKSDFEKEVELSDQQIEMVLSLIDLAHEANQINIQMVPTIRKFDNL